MSVNYITLSEEGDALSGNGATVECNLTGPWTYFIDGTIGAATVTIEASWDGTNWAATGVSENSGPATGYVQLFAPFLRAVVTGGTSPDVGVHVVRGEY